MTLDLQCGDVQRELSNYIEGELSFDLRACIEGHVRDCPRCKAVLDGMKNVVALAADERALTPPEGFGDRLRERIRKHRAMAPTNVREIPLGISGDTVPLGSHMVYFWQDEAEFRKGVKFLEAGITNGEHCVVQGHQEAVDLTLQVLRDDGFDPERLLAEKRLTIWLRGKQAGGTMQDLSLIVEAAIRAGAPAVRMFGNLGRGKEDLPGGEDDILELEARTTNLISRLPCVLVCMYDVRTLSGRLVLKGGMQSHPHTLCEDGLEANPQYVPEQRFLVGIRRT